MSLSWEQIPGAVSAAIGGKPVRWASAGPSIGDYDGRETTLDVFDVEARDQRRLLRQLRDLRREIEQAIGSPVVLVFHTPAQTSAFYPDVRRHPAPAVGPATPQAARWLEDVFAPATTVISANDLAAGGITMSTFGPASTIGRNRWAGSRSGRTIAIPRVRA
ncbi:MAG TPA: hypothetical protein VK698_22530 [Kofleriaceae bacterium]|nr:hypothetical protein [Kofleriaceae bacterium]